LIDDLAAAKETIELIWCRWRKYKRCAIGISCDLSTKLLHLAWHPTENSIACAVANSLYMYYE
jgi:hypothetical protein